METLVRNGKKEFYRNNSNLPVTVNSVHIFNSLSLVFSGRNRTYCKKSLVIDSLKITCYFRYSRYCLV